MPIDHERVCVRCIAALALTAISACTGRSSFAEREDAGLSPSGHGPARAQPTVADASDRAGSSPPAATGAAAADAGSALAGAGSSPPRAQDAAGTSDAGSPSASGVQPTGSGPSTGGGAGSGAATGADGGAAADAGAAPHAIDCSRAGLDELVATYLSALSAHDPARIPVSPALKFTENGSALQLGEGSWQTAGTLLAQRSALDVDSCGTVTEAAFDAQGRPMLVGVRLKLEGLALTEIESYVVDQLTGPPKSLVGATNSAQWLSPVPNAERSSRERLAQIADAYLDNLGDPSRPAPFAMPCDQAVNGLGAAQIADDIGPGPAVPHTCGSVLLPVIPGLPNINASPTHRRYPVADVEAGIAVAFGLVAEDRLSFSMLKVIDAKIRFVEAVVGPSVTSPGW